MASRPAGLVAVAAAFAACELDLGQIIRAQLPVLYVLGGRSNPAWYAAMADRLAAALPDFTLEVFEERHHFDPPHRAEPERLARARRLLVARPPVIGARRSNALYRHTPRSPTSPANPDRATPESVQRCARASRSVIAVCARSSAALSSNSR